MSIQSNISKESNAESLDLVKMDGAKDLSYNTKNPILNPQEEVPDVISKYTVIKDKVEAIDLNEDRWSTDYYVVFFHTGPHDFVSSELLKKLDKKNNPGINEFPCKIIAISMDSYEVIQDWIKKTPDLKDFDVPMLSDKKNDLAGQFGCLLGEQFKGEDHPGPGYCANSVFIVDGNDRVRYHSVLDARLGHDLDEIARVVKAFKATDGGSSLAMSTWKDSSDSVENSKDRIKEWYSAKSAKKSFDWKSAISISSSTKTSKKSSDDSKAGTSSSANSGKMIPDKRVATLGSTQGSGSEADRDSKTGSVLNGTWKYEFGALTLSPVESKSV